VICRNKLALVLVAIIGLSACSPAATPSAVPRPTQAVTPGVAISPTSLPPVTPTPHPPLEALACPLEYTRYVAWDLHFAACYPTGWTLTTQQEPEIELRRLTFSAPAGATGVELRSVVVTVSAAMPGLDDQDFLQDLTHWLKQEYYDHLLSGPQIVLVDGHRAVDATYEAQVPLGREIVDVIRWVTVLSVGERQWFIDVAGLAEDRAELEYIRGQFLAHLHILEE